MIIGFSLDLDIGEKISILGPLGWFVSVIAGMKRNRKKCDTPATCSKCQSVMWHYYYNDEISEHDSNGIVYLCHSCNIKFIDTH
ncbi:hypothetical protein MNBD_GAMMA19-1713, partial [hydrothermal vent metagenome]